MSDSKGQPPGPMTKRRMALMQKRADAGEPLAVPSDQADIRESIENRARHKSQRRDGVHTAARTVGSRSKQTAESKFDEDGEEIEKAGEFVAVDRYLSTTPGTQAAAEALQLWKSQRDLSTSGKGRVTA